MVKPLTPLIIDFDKEQYVSKLERVDRKLYKWENLSIDEYRDKVNTKDNIALYDILTDKLRNTILKNCPGSIATDLANLRDEFIRLRPIDRQVNLLLGIIR